MKETLEEVQTWILALAMIGGTAVAINLWALHGLPTKTLAFAQTLVWVMGGGAILALGTTIVLAVSARRPPKRSPKDVTRIFDKI